jgi:hypothetical protein
MASPPTFLKPTQSSGALVRLTDQGCWRLEVSAGARGAYRLAQLDDYSHLRRKQFPWQPPISLRLRARASAADLPGTWGFGFWNDPFGTAIMRSIDLVRLPALPNAAWFFFASRPNYLSLRDDLPARGALAAVFRSPQAPFPLLALAAPLLPLLFWPAAARRLRRLARRFVQQDAATLPIAATAWHSFTLEWQFNGVRLGVDETVVLESTLSPLGPLGFVLWLDNQFAALPPNGRILFGTLPTPEPAWIEIDRLEIG